MTVWRREPSQTYMAHVTTAKKKMKTFLFGICMVPGHNLTYSDRFQQEFKKRHFTTGGIFTKPTYFLEK